MIPRCFNLQCLLCPTLLAIGACGQPASTPQTPLDDVRIYKLTEKQLDAYLARLARKEPDYLKRIAVIAQATIGQPYRLGPLGEFPYELRDPDPLYCLSASDCVTFVEQTLAMALSHDWPSFFHTLQRIRYKDARIGILTRNHFTEADWNRNNAWLLDDLTKNLPGAIPFHVCVKRAAFFKQFKIEVSPGIEEFDDVQVPRDRLASILPQLRDADIIEFVRTTKGQPYVGHLGFVFHDTAGKTTLLHATKPTVREVPLEDYVKNHENITGFKFLRLRPDAASSP